MRKKRRELILFCSLLLATTPAYAENATEAVSISWTRLLTIGWTIDANEEVQSVSESDTPKTLASNEETSSPKIWQETYTYLADTQDSHAFPDRVEKNGVQYQLKDTQYQITELTKEYRKSSTNLWAYAEYNPEQEIEVDGLHYTLVDTSKEEWTESGRSKTVSVDRTYLEGRKFQKPLILNRPMI